MNELGNTPADKNYKPSGISKAEERALEIFPSTEKEWKSEFGTFHFDDTNVEHREGFIVGYEQAEKDLALTWKDMRKIIRIDEEMMDDPEAHPEWMEEQPFYEEMLQRFKETRNENKTT